MPDTPLLPSDRAVPSELRTRHLWLRRQRLEDAEADHAAVMASRSALREWSDSDWPEDDFTLERNRDDLAGHIADALAGTAYGFTVWEPSGTLVLGSVYLEAAASLLESYPHDESIRRATRSCDVRVEYWLRSGTPRALEHELVEALRPWLRDAWGFRRPCWGSRQGMVERRAMLEALGLVELVVLRAADRSRSFHLHAEPPDGRPWRA